MRAHIPGRYAALALLLGGLACAGNKAGSDDGTVVAQDSTQTNDTSAYKGQARDTTALPAPAPTTIDSSASDLPSSTPADTSSYAPAAPTTPTDTNSSSGIERADTLSGNEQSASPTAAPTTPTADTNSSSGIERADTVTGNK